MTRRYAYETRPCRVLRTSARPADRMPQPIRVLSRLLSAAVTASSAESTTPMGKARKRWYFYFLFGYTKLISDLNLGRSVIAYTVIEAPIPLLRCIVVSCGAVHRRRGAQARRGAGRVTREARSVG